MIAGFLGHLFRRPGRVEDDFHFHVAHARELAEDLLAVSDHLRAGGAHGAGHRHFDLAGRLVVGSRNQINLIDEAQIDDVDDQLGIDDLFQLFENEGFATTPIAERETRRGIMGPQYYAYTLGKHEILSLREKLRARQGASYDQLAFHDAFMQLPYPVPVIEQILLGNEN